MKIDQLSIKHVETRMVAYQSTPAPLDPAFYFGCLADTHADGGCIATSIFIWHPYLARR